MRKKYMKKSSPDSWLHSQLVATNALFKFCDEHKYNDSNMIHLNACKTALENKNITEAIHEYTKIPLGGNGCFNDWWPDTVFDHETEEYVNEVFKALLAHWSKLMRLSLDTNA